ncbi:MAG: polyphosphate kinase 1 [Cytophagales bacterium]|nr:polyphosphate kinase 1 [Cytophagales bacterium]
MQKNNTSKQIHQSNYISRDLSWLKFNYRVLDQVKDSRRNIFERLRFLTIAASNLDEFFMIRIGSLYNYIDFGKKRVDYSGMRETPFKIKLLEETKLFANDLNECYRQQSAEFEKNGFCIGNIEQSQSPMRETLQEHEKEEVAKYFMDTIYPMLTPMVYDNHHAFPILMNHMLIFGVVTKSKEDKKISFVQIPQNLPRFYEIYRGNQLIFLPIEDIIKWRIDKLYRNIKIDSVNLFRITRNADFSVDESDDVEIDFINEIKRKLKGRKTGRVVRLEVEETCSAWMLDLLKQRFEIDNDNVFIIMGRDAINRVSTHNDEYLFDFTSLSQVFNHDEFKDKLPAPTAPVLPLSFGGKENGNVYEYLKDRDILLHHPYNSIEPVITLLEQAAEDPNVLAIKITIYRFAKDSRITAALLKAAENGKHVSVLFEVQARFDEENNIREAQKLQKSGCFVIYGISRHKTHTKLLLIVRKEGKKVTSYVHMSTGNYNEITSNLYSDISLLTTDETYAHDVSEFFNVITGHSMPKIYQYLITAPRDMRQKIIELIQNEVGNAKKGVPSGLVFKMNSLEDKATIDELYKASRAGVPIKLIIRGICCLRPGRKGLSENISVCSIVGNYLEHIRIYYFHNAGDPKVYGGSADIMLRSFERRVESLFLIADERLKKEAINILDYNLVDNMNQYTLHENGNYVKTMLNGKAPFDIHKEFFKVTHQVIEKVKLF